MTLEVTGPVLTKLPRDGYELYFREDRHAYQIVNPKGKPGMRYPGASTIGHATCEGYASVVASILGVAE